MTDHLIITPPDRFYGDGKMILLIDWDWAHVEIMVDKIRNYEQQVILNLFGPNETNYKWILDVSYQCGLILINMNNRTMADPLKGVLLSKPQTFYTGRQDLESLFPGYVNDPIGKLLSHLSTSST